MAQKKPVKKVRKAKKQKEQPGIEHAMAQKPEFIDEHYQGSAKLENKIAIITGGDSGIGRAIAIAFAMEGADVMIPYLKEHRDAKTTKEIIEALGRRCEIVAGDVAKPNFCQKVIDRTLKLFKKIDILVNNAAEQHPENDFNNITIKQLENTFKTNVFGYFFMIKSALPAMKKGATIINTTSVTAYRGSAHLIDYSATKGAIVSLTRSLSANLIDKGIRVNAVAPGPIWTPLIVSTFSPEKIATFGSNCPMGRAGQPKEVAPCYVFLASNDSSYMSGQVLHPNGGEIING